VAKVKALFKACNLVRDVKRDESKHMGEDVDPTGLVGGFSPTHLEKYESKWVHLPQGSG